MNQFNLRVPIPLFSAQIIIRKILIAAHSTRHRLGPPSSSSLSSHCRAALSAAILHASRGRGMNKDEDRSKISARDINRAFRLSNYETSANLAKGISRLSIEISIPRWSLSSELLVQNRIASSSSRRNRFTICFHRLVFVIDHRWFISIWLSESRRDVSQISEN